jgi:membrane protein implicated in regulation of membrane protease activity
MHPRRTLILGVGIFVLLALSMQIFLIMVGLEAWLTFDTRIAWGAAVASVLLAAMSVVLYRYLQRGDRGEQGPGARRRRLPQDTRR